MKFTRATFLLVSILASGCTGNDFPNLNVDTGAMDAGHDGAVSADGGRDGGRLDAASSGDTGLDAPAMLDAPDAFAPDAFAPDAFVDHCVGVVCTAADACHTVGVCNPATGTCSNPPVSNGTSCNDANACTSPDTCQAGTCTPGSAVTCTAADACHLAGTCAAASGCSSPFAPEGTTCTFATGPGGCHTGTCVSRCTDSVRNGPETDADCGGDCAGCALGRMCAVNADCASSACNATTLTCVASQCSDAHRDGAETDVDCGGPTCPRCAVGRVCAVNSDCTSTACNVVTFQCAASQCSDAHRDGVETDIDCGGGTCPACAVGRQCAVDTDCTSNACDALTFTCIANQCADHRRDGTETDIDCGGGTCPMCALGLRCTLDPDCTSNACDAISNTCVANQCSDHRRDGAETDVDCGGASACARCTVGMRCIVNSDCMGGHVCSPATNICV